MSSCFKGVPQLLQSVKFNGFSRTVVPCIAGHYAVCLTVLTPTELTVATVVSYIIYHY